MDGSELRPMDTPESSNQELSFIAGSAAVALCVLFGANAVAIKISLTGLGVFTTAGLRFGMAAGVIFLWAIATGRSFTIPKGSSRHLVVTGVLFAAQLSVFYAGISRTNASRGTLLANMQPFFTLFLAHFFIEGDRITWRKLTGILLGFGGVVCVFWERGGPAAEFQTGDWLVLTATALWAVNAVYVKRVIHLFKPFQVTFYPMVIAVPLFVAAAVLWDAQPVSRWSTEVVGALLYQGLVTASFAFVAWNTLLKRYGAVAMHSFIFIMPIAGVSLGALVLGEPITLKIVLAMVLIVSGILTVNVKIPRRFPTFFWYRG